MKLMTKILFFGLFISLISITAKSQSNRDLCLVDVFPYIVDFEAEGLIPYCWEQDAINDHDWIFNDNTGEGAYEGEYYAKFDHENYGDIGMLVTPPLDLSSLSSPRLSFWHSQQAYGEDQDELTVYYRISESDPWQVLPGGFFTEDIPSWTLETIPLPNPSSSYQIGFEAYDDYGYGVRLDYVVIEEEICAAPSSMTVSNIGETTAELDWTANGGESIWNLIISTSPVEDFESASLIEVLAQPHYDIVGMLSNTKYYIYVQAVCSGDNQSEWVETTVLTDCPWFAELPLDEDFDESWNNWCWRVIDNDNDGNTWQKAANYIDPFSGTSTAYGSGNQDDYLILPRLFLQDQYLLKWMDIVETSDHNNTYEVLVSTSNSDIESFTINLGTFDCTNETWTQHVVSLNEFEDQEIYVAFHQTHSSSLVHGFGLDNLRIEQGTTSINNNCIIESSNIYPNPAKDYIRLNIQLSDNNKLKYEIYNLSGQVVQSSQEEKNKDHKISISVSELPAGVYFIKASSGQEIITEKFIKE